MKRTKEIEGRKCPKCGSTDEQRNSGLNRSGTQRCTCKKCNIMYTFNPKTREYSEAVREIAMREYFMGISARGVGKIHRMSKANVLRWVKKTRGDVDKPED